jgi:hypothetical protein
LSHYLPRLLELGLIERRVPATIPLDKIKTSRQSRYHLNDPFLRFYYRFVDPNLHLIEHGLTHRLWESIDESFRAFVALNFEQLCREWVLKQAQAGRLPFAPDNVGTHWSRAVQVDVVAIAWRTKQVLVGEAKWGERPVGRSVVIDLVDRKTPRLLKDLADGGEGWTVHCALWAAWLYRGRVRSRARGGRSTAHPGSDRTGADVGLRPGRSGQSMLNCPPLRSVL